MSRNFWRPRAAPLSNTIYVGDSPWRKCECGKWLDKATGEHIELTTISFKELMDQYGSCPDKKKDE